MNKDTIEALKKIKEEAFDFSNVDKVTFAYQLFEDIGHQDSIIRDELIYEVLAHLFHDGHFNEEELTTFLKILMSDMYLFYDMENKVTWSVLKRSFSILQLVVLVYVHRRDGLIEHQLIQELFDQFLIYIDKEEVYIGYDEHVGWVHAIAHSADLFAQFMQCQSFNETRIKMMFETIARLIKNKKHCYMFNEDKRLVSAIKKGIDRNVLSESYLLNWLKEFKVNDKDVPLPEMIYMKQNITHFLSHLYFTYVEDDSYKWLNDAIMETIKTIK